MIATSTSLPSRHDPVSTGLAPVAIGFGGVIVTWVLAWVLHLPSIDASATVTLPILLVGLVMTYILMLRDHPAQGRMKTALIAGVINGIVNLLIVGSIATEQPDSTDALAYYANQFRSEAIFIIPGSILFCIVAGLIAGAAARGGPGHLTTRAGWLARLGFVTVAVYLPLIVVGGAVTSTESGLAVPDAVTSYGAISVLFPFELMSEPRIFLEHSHRLFGTLAGLTTIVLMVCVLAFDHRRGPKLLAIALLAAVCFQGYMGIKRVSELSTPIAILHGVFGQIVFTLSGVLAAALSLSWRNLASDEERAAIARKARTVAWAAVVCLLLQLAMGAAARHLGRMDPPSPGANHARLTHAAFAFVVMFLIVIGGSLAIRTGRTGAGFAPVRRMGIGLHGIVTVQFLLGWAALGLIMVRDEPAVIPTADQLATAAPIRVLEALVTTSHQATGALLLLLTAVAAAWLGRLARAKLINQENT
jgi:cytochrome c oxidase assembly protein subunit 15